MTQFTDFLVSNYLWFLVVSIVLLFALIGYFVDQKEQKKGISKIVKVKGPETNIEDLAAFAQNKSLNNAVSDAAQGNINMGMGVASMPSTMNVVNMPNTNNVIQEANTLTGQVVQQQSSNPIGFDVLTK